MRTENVQGRLDGTDKYHLPRAHTRLLWPGLEIQEHHLGDARQLAAASHPCELGPFSLSAYKRPAEAFFEPQLTPRGLDIDSSELDIDPHASRYVK